MPEFIGSSLYVQWTYGATGTMVMGGDYRSFNYAPSIELLDGGAGSDPAKIYTPSIKDGKATYKGVMQTGGTMTANGAGTIFQAFTEGTAGTLTWGPEGTATGKVKQTAPFISLGVAYNPVYNNIVEFSVDFQQNGARTDGTY